MVDCWGIFVMAAAKSLSDGPASDSSQSWCQLIILSHSDCDFPGSWYGDFQLYPGHLGYYW